MLASAAAAFVSRRKKFGGGPGTPGSYIFVALADSLNRFREVLPLPFEIGSQGIIESGGRVPARRLAYSSNCALHSSLSGIISMGWPRFPSTHRKTSRSSGQKLSERTAFPRQASPPSFVEGPAPTRFFAKGGTVRPSQRDY
jgi:hypothetical protein